MKGADPAHVQNNSTHTCTDFAPSPQSPNMTTMVMDNVSVQSTEEAHALSLDEVYDAQFDYVWRSLRRLGARPADLEDLTHDVFVTFIRTLDRFDADRSVKPWLFGIAFRVLSDHRRLARFRREVPQDGREHVSPLKGPSEALEATRRRQHIADALDQLSHDERAVLVMVCLQGHSVVEASRALEVNENTLYSRLRRAKATFASVLKAESPLGATT